MDKRSEGSRKSLATSVGILWAVTLWVSSPHASEKRKSSGKPRLRITWFTRFEKTESRDKSDRKR